MSKKCVFVTGGAGYIGSHCCVELLQADYDVVAIDNFANSRHTGAGEAPALKRVEEITSKKLTFYQCDLLDAEKVNAIFDKHQIDYVIHFAAIKAVGESMQFPLLYYKNNVIGTINLVEAMKAHNVYHMVFSSSCCVYGDPEHLPITEDHPTGNVTNVYGRTKYLIEEMLKDLTHAEPKWNIISLRYFNPVGAHPSGRIGEDPTKNFTNLMPYIAQVALGNKPHINVFGGDYNTPDGTGVRDYIHIMDLASGHVAALNKLSQEHFRYKTYNLGTGEGVSVKQLAAMFERVTGRPVPCLVQPRRLGDIVSMFANASRARQELGWTAQRSLEDMCRDMWRWQTMNPRGYQDDCDAGAAATTGQAALAKAAAVTNGVANGVSNGVSGH
ncbi:UDP-glucose 4-epimerase-like isoform X1 [Pollicipes pollicipes]|uniref:UDP-glucose 4-epimerase-like isoform X1 n=1 Tax=Pollicipes pollicipes TaxID=41117 RepID=UPI00188523A0|nr:UDP-glucose 4-epimerase-like isoform X1 [Pollicipes pollicipes]